MADAPPKPTGKGGIMQKKIAGIPVPLAALIVVAVGYLAYRHYQNASASGTSGVSSQGNSAVDPNAVDPATGLTYGAEQQAAMGAGGGSPGNGTGSGGAGGGISLGDLEGLLQSIQGLGATNYYYGGGGSGSDVTPTNPTGPGAGTTSQTAPTAISPSSLAAPAPAPTSSPASTGGPAGPAANAFGPPTPSAPFGTIGEFSAYPIISDIASTPVSQNVPPPDISMTQVGTAPETNYPIYQFGTPTITVNNPTISANKEGGSANKKQGIYSTH